MELIAQGVKEALRLLVSFDPEVVRITALSLEVSGAATVLGLLLGIPAGTALALADFPGKRLLIGLVNTGMGLPPVVVGLFITVLLWRNGPLGDLGLLYTPAAIVIAQTVLAAPIIMGITVAAIQQLPKALHQQILALGAGRAQAAWLLMKEARLPVLAAVMAGFGAVISEVGAVIMVGGNIKGHTRVLTSATVLETSKGNFDMAIALGIILLVFTCAANLLLTELQQRGGS